MVVRALIYNHGLPKDGIAAGERRPFGVLELPRAANCIARDLPEIADMVIERRGTVVPAVRLTWRLQVPAGAAAVPVVPPPLVDGVPVAFVGEVGQILHPRPHEDGRAETAARVELNELDLAVRIRGRVSRVGLHPAVAAHHSALVWVLHAPAPPSPEVWAEPCDGGP